MAATDLPKPFDELYKELYLKFLEKFERREDHQQRFAPIGTAKKVLKPSVLSRFFRSLDWSYPLDRGLSEEGLIMRVDDRGLHDFLAILLFSSCTVKDARTFTTKLLIEDTFATDGFALPTDDEVLKSVFKEKVTRDGFLTTQAIFCPVVIQQGKEVRVEHPSRCRFPYLEENHRGQGGFGTVYAVKIARGHFYDSRYGTVNLGPLELARKDYVITDGFNEEHEVLKKILASDRKCDNIVDNFGCFAIGPNNYSLFMPLAICDLSQYMMEIHQFPPSATKERAEIISSARGLAGGLRFLHHEMKTPEGEELVCYHMDLKPSNVLIFKGDDGKKIWKISDFGMARVKLKKRGENVMTERDFNSWFVKHPKHPPEPSSTGTRNQRGEGTYLAPESLGPNPTMKTSSDVWSLGCVLSVVFVFLEEGWTGVTKYSEERSEHAKANGIDRFFLYNKKKLEPIEETHPVAKVWHKRLVRSAEKRDHREGKALEQMLRFLEKSVFRERSERCPVVEVEEMLKETYKAYSDLKAPEPLPLTIDPSDPNESIMDTAIRLLTRRTAPPESLDVRKWVVKVTKDFKDCAISSDGSLVVFWTDTELTLFTSLSLSSRVDEAKPQDEWSPDKRKLSGFWKRVCLTNRHLLACTSADKFHCYVFDLKKSMVVDPCFGELKQPTPDEPEIVDLAISSDSEQMACVLRGTEGSQGLGSLYIAPIQSPEKPKWLLKLDCPATDIVEITFPTDKDIYFVVRPIVHIHSQEETAKLVHVSLEFMKLESVEIKAQGFEAGANVGLFTTFAPVYQQPSKCAVVTKERRLYVENLLEASNGRTVQADIKNYRILKLMTGWDAKKMLAVGRHVANYNMILLEVELPVFSFSKVLIKKLAQFPGVSYNDRFVVQTQGTENEEKYVVLAALMSANQRAIYKVQI